jgi:hypothetical protein
MKNGQKSRKCTLQEACKKSMYQLVFLDQTGPPQISHSIHHLSLVNTSKYGIWTLPLFLGHFGPSIFLKRYQFLPKTPNEFGQNLYFYKTSPLGGGGDGFSANLTQFPLVGGWLVAKSLLPQGRTYT